MAKAKDAAEPDYGTREDVKRAIDALSPEDERRLEQFARYKIRGLGRKAMGRDHKDLLQEAVKSTVLGADGGEEGRRWRKSAVKFVQHLYGAMRSIASHWGEAMDEDEAHLDSEVTAEIQDGELLSPIENAPSANPDQERVLLAKERIEDIYTRFHNDEDAALVLEGISRGWNGPEIAAKLALPQNRYEAALKRIRYHLK